MKSGLVLSECWFWDKAKGRCDFYENYLFYWVECWFSARVIWGKKKRGQFERGRVNFEPNNEEGFENVRIILRAICND